MDKITIKTPNPKFRVYWGLIEFTDWRASQSSCYFQPLLRTSAPLTFSLGDPPAPPPVRVIAGVCNDTVCVTEGRGPQTDKLLSPNPFTGQFLRKDDL
jgi:hypothetical protein